MAAALAMTSGTAFADVSIPPVVTPVGSLSAGIAGGLTVTAVAVPPAGLAPPLVVAVDSGAAQPVRVGTAPVAAAPAAAAHGAAAPAGGVARPQPAAPEAAAATGCAQAAVDPACAAAAPTAAALGLVPLVLGAGGILLTPDLGAATCPAVACPAGLPVLPVPPAPGAGPAAPASLAAGVPALPLSLGEVDTGPAPPPGAAQVPAAARQPASGPALASTGSPLVAGLAGLVLFAVGGVLTWKRARPR